MASEALEALEKLLAKYPVEFRRTRGGGVVNLKDLLLLGDAIVTVLREHEATLRVFAYEPGTGDEAFLEILGAVLNPPQPQVDLEVATIKLADHANT